jgi:hypothetical protein
VQLVAEVQRELEILVSERLLNSGELAGAGVEGAGRGLERVAVEGLASEPAPYPGSGQQELAG